MRSSFFLAFFTFAISCHAAESLDAPNLDAQMIDQKPIHAFGCGPIALFNAYRLSSDEWRKPTQKITGDPELGFNYFTKTYCSRFSRNSYLKRRWDAKNGIRPDDLTEAINEFQKKAKLPTVSLKPLFLKNEQSHRELLVEVHTQIAHSIHHGFPPLLSVTRFARINSPSGGHRWAERTSHFITVIRIPRELEVNAQSFSFDYVDPWGGEKCTSRFTISKSTFFANDITNRKDKRHHKNPTLVIPSGALGVGAGLVSASTPQAVAVTHLIVADASATTQISPQ